MILTIVSFLLLLGVLMFFHELGHYWLARRNGIEVEEFGVFGFPPRLVKLFTYKGTVFSLNAIPLGAFVRMKGEDIADASPGSFNAAGAGARAAVLIAGPAMNILLAIVFSIAAVLSGFPAIVANPEIVQVAQNSPAANLGLQPGDILLEVNGQPVYVSGMNGDIVRSRESGATFSAGGNELIMLRDGRAQQIALPAGTTPRQLLDSAAVNPVLHTRITHIVEGSPANIAGLQPGDIVYAVDGIAVVPPNSLSALVAERLDTTLTLTVLRDGQFVDVPVFARQNPPAGEGAMGVGIDSRSMLVTLPFLQAVWEGTVRIFDYIRMVLAVPGMLIMGQMSTSDAGVSGPVGIAQLVGGAVDATVNTGFWFPIFQLAAVISAGLAIANLLPIPALDGGRLLFILFEKIRGRRFNPEMEGAIHLVGFALLLGLMVMVTISDIRSGPEAIDWSRILGQ
jgi:regulator of sigma E protease